MASSGRNINQTSFVAIGPEQASQAIVAATSVASGYSITNAGMGSIVLTRKYLPTWALVLAIVGAVFMLLGLLLLLVRNTEVLTITLVSNEGGTKIVVTGTGSQEMGQRLLAVIQSMPVEPVRA